MGSGRVGPGSSFGEGKKKQAERERITGQLILLFPSGVSVGDWGAVVSSCSPTEYGVPSTEIGRAICKFFLCEPSQNVVDARDKRLCGGDS